MKRTYILPLVALAGIGMAIVAIINSNNPSNIKTQGILQYQSPFDSYVAGAGIVEATTGNISIGTPVSGIVMAIYVKVGAHVKAGDPLFKIDDRDLQARLLTAKAKVNEATAALQKPKHRLAHADQLIKRDPRAISVQDISDLHDESAQSEAMLALAKAQLEQIQLEIKRHTVRAPLDGEILQLRMRLGEFIEGSSTAPPLLILGGNKRMNLRVDVDESDAWRIQPDTNAVAFVRGHPELKIPLHYEYIEPKIIPKTSLTGQSTERTDTRVLQVIYSFKLGAFPVYIGQQMDVFIQAAASNFSKTKP